MTEKTAIQERNERYNKYVESVSPKTSSVKALFNSFWIGGLTCLAGEIIFDLYTLSFPSMAKDMVSNLTLMTVITIAIFLTGIGVFDKIGRMGGAGMFLPITGFANAMSSAAMEFKAEGLIMGTSTKLFTVVGPVIVNGIIWSSIAGLIHLIAFGRLG